MAIPFKTHDVYVLDAPLLADAHGNRSRSARDWDNAARDGPHEASVQPDAGTMGASLATQETTAGGRAMTRTTMMIRLNPNAPVKDSSGIEVGGRIYQVTGEPVPMPDPLGGGLEHIAVKAQLVRG